MYAWSVLQSCQTLCDPVDPVDPVHQAPLSRRFSRQEYWSGLPCPPLGDLPDPGIKPTSLTSIALAGRFFTTSTIWEILAYSRDSISIDPFPSFLAHSRLAVLSLVSSVHIHLCVHGHISVCTCVYNLKWWMRGKWMNHSTPSNLLFWF